MLRNLLLFGLLGSVLVFAQGGRGGGRNGGGDMGAQASFGPVNKFDRISDMLKLNKDQKKELKQTFDEAQKEAAPLHEQMTKARLAIAEGITAQGTPEDIQKAVDTEAALETQMTLLEMRAFVKFVGVLEPDQQQRASGLFAIMRGMFSGKNWNAD